MGGGISGLACAHALHGDHEIVVFEAGERAGGHAHTVRVDTDEGPYDVDTGFIVFNDRNYPHFEAILRELAVETQPSHMSFGVSDGDGFEYNGSTPNGLFAVRRHILSARFQRMIADLIRFNRDARALLGAPESPSLREWLAQMDYSEDFIERLIVPQAAAVWSADPAQMWSFPARFMVEFFDNHGMLGFRNRPRWRTVTGGSRRYVEALTKPWRERIRLAAPVTEIRRGGESVTVTARGADGERFDAVVLATHSDQALAMLADPSERERELLGAIPYQRNEAVLHTDRSLLPRRRRAWASWNYHLAAHPTGASTVTYHMNRLQSLSSKLDFCVTLNRTGEIDPAQIIRRIDYAHPVYTPAAVAAQARRQEISGVNRTYYCGAYWGWGFHEDGVVSGLRVAGELGARRAMELSV